MRYGQWTLYGGIVQAMKTIYPMLAAAVICGAQAAHAQDAFTLYADDGDRITVEETVSFAVVGNTRGAESGDTAAGRSNGGREVAHQIFSDIAGAQPEFVVLMGDMVRSGRVPEYKKLREAAAPIAAARVIPVVGDQEVERDPQLETWAQYFPGAGADIGFNRVGSWMWFDVKTQAHIYRFLILDSNKQSMGSRWQEQLNWLPSALEGRFESLFVFVHHPMLELGGQEPKMNPQGVTKELLDIVELGVELNQIRAIFSAGTHVSSVIRPDGPFGTLYVGAGGGGAPADDLSRWYFAEAAGLNQDVGLEPVFDMAVLNALRAVDDDQPVPRAVMDQATASGAFDGFRGVVQAKHMPTHGWFDVSLEGENVRIAFRHRTPNGEISQRYSIQFSKDGGWLALP